MSVLEQERETLDFAEYGNKDGQPVIYFHGVPGAIEECALFDAYGKAHNLSIVCFDRFAIDNRLNHDDYYQVLADQITNKIGSKPVDFIGFSIGAHVALEVSARLKDQVGQIHLVSAAAPLGGGDFIDKVAGGLVFKLAMKKPFIFYLLTQYQKIIAMLAPQFLVKLLFASAAGKDKALSKTDDFKSYITLILKHCFLKRTSGYIRDVDFYVAWQGKLSVHNNSVQLWHGTEDNWSTFSMAEYLNKEIPGSSGVNAMQGLSHYSCLYQAAPKICAQLAKAS